MRLIDVDKLETHEQLEPWGNGNYEYVEVVYKDDIDDAPTIEPERRWIPCSERLPKDDGEYLVWIQWDYEEEPSYSIVNYDANAESFGEWHEYFDPDTLGSLGSDFRSFEGVFAWMPLPEPYKGDEEWKEWGVKDDQRG